MRPGGAHLAHLSGSSLIRVAQSAPQSHHRPHRMSDPIASTDVPGPSRALRGPRRTAQYYVYVCTYTPGCMHGYTLACVVACSRLLHDGLPCGTQPPWTPLGPLDPAAVHSQSFHLIISTPEDHRTGARVYMYRPSCVGGWHGGGGQRTAPRQGGVLAARWSPAPLGTAGET